jgi:hypothetical protein
MFTRHHPNGEGGEHLNNIALESAIVRYQTQGDVQSLTKIIELSTPRAQTLIRYYRTHLYRDESELISDCHYKLVRSIGRFDAGKGSAFSFVSAVVTSTLKTAVSNQRRNWSRNVELDGELANSLPAKADDWSVADDLIFKVKSRVRTTLTNEVELEAQKWLVTSFCQEGFASRRHTCADACMGVYQITHARSRELHDLSALEVRRALFDDLRHRDQVIANRLLGTRCAWMARYKPLLSATEFTKFYFLMKNLAPYLLLLIVDPANNRNHRRDRCPKIDRPTLELILDGDPGARPLFQ